MRSRRVSLLAAAIFVSALGDFLALVPLALHIEERTESGVAVSVLFIALWGPLVVFSGPAGLLVDRLDRVQVLVIVSLLQAAIAVGLAFSEALLPVLALTALLGTLNAVSQPAEFALIPTLVDERLTQANARIETARFLGFAAGPLLGGLLSAAGGLRLALNVDAASFLAVAGAVALMRPRRAAESGIKESDVGRARDGMVFLLQDRALRLVLIVAIASLLFMTASAPAEVFFAKDVLDAGDVGFGALWGIWTFGMAVGALGLAGRVRGGALAGAALAAIVVQSLGLAIPTLWLSLAFALALYLVGGTAHGLKNVLLRTLIHERVPAHLHGRAFAAYNGIRNAAELFALLGGGLLVVAIGARWTLFLAGALPALAGLVGLVVYRRVRDGPSRLRPRRRFSTSSGRRRAVLPREAPRRLACRERGAPGRKG
jgi:MFS family permease